MKKTTLGILVMTVGLWATVPYTFTPNTPARASEVNANFQALSDKLVVLEGNSQTSTDACNKSVFSYTYQYIPSNIGDTITIGEPFTIPNTEPPVVVKKEYVIVAMPFIEHGTGERYYIKKPVSKFTVPEGYFVNIDLSTNYVEQGTLCYPSSFSGFPANYHNGIFYKHDYIAGMKGHDLDDTVLIGIPLGFSINATTGLSTEIKINQTTFTLQAELSKGLHHIPILAAGDVDTRDDIDWSALGTDTALVDDLKTLMNYVEIVKIQ